jgi:hypothetical protein
MKLKTLSEILSASTIGASIGLWAHQCNVQAVGNETLTLIRIKPQETERVHRSTHQEILPILYWAIVALIAFAVFKVLAAAIYGVLSSIFTKEKTAQF